MGMYFSEPYGREFFLRSSGGEEVLLSLETHFSKWPFSREEENTIKRFFVREPEGRHILMDYLKKNPGIPLEVQSFELLPKHDIVGIILFNSPTYVLLENLWKGLILVEQNTCFIDKEKYIF